MKMILIAASFFILTGCKSEVDKCVEAGIQAVEIKNPMSKAEKLNAEYDFRVWCLKAQSGKT